MCSFYVLHFWFFKVKLLWRCCQEYTLPQIRVPPHKWICKQPPRKLPNPEVNMENKQTIKQSKGFIIEIDTSTPNA